MASYTPEQTAKYRAIFIRCEREVVKAKNPQVKYAWDESVVNGIDTASSEYRTFCKQEFLDPREFSRADMMRLYTVQTCAGFTTDSQFTDATRRWFAKRGIRG